MKNELENTLKKYKYFSNNDTRSFVVECSVALESIVSITLSYILGIKDWENSKSLGYSNGSLSFNQKVRLIQDIIELNDKDTPKKFQEFMTIRNKFAHVEKIDSFNSYLELFKNSNDTKNKFKRWFPKYNFECKNPEENYKNAFMNLYHELISKIIELNENYMLPKAFEKGLTLGKLAIYEYLQNELNKSDSGKEILKRAKDNADDPPFPGSYNL